MTTKTSAKFSITGWDEQAFAEFDGPEKMTRAITGQRYTGDLTGESRGDSLMYYGPSDAPVSYVGLERFTCTVGGKSGTFVAQSHGTYADGVASTSWFVVPGSGTGELTGIRGEGGYAAKGGEDAVTVTFDYYFEA